MKTAKVKAKRYWKTAAAKLGGGRGIYLYADKKSAHYFSGFNAAKVKPVAVLPADADSIERMVEQMARALFADTYKNYLHFDPSLFNELREYERNFYKAQARAALAAIGVKSCPAQNRKNDKQKP
jgi:hypothetical protein